MLDINELKNFFLENNNVQDLHGRVTSLIHPLNVHFITLQWSEYKHPNSFIRILILIRQIFSKKI